MAKSGFVFLVILVVMLVAGPASATILYTSGLPWNSTYGQLGISGSGVYVTDPFTLSSASTITSIDLGLWDAFSNDSLGNPVVSNPSSVDYTIQNASGTVLANGAAGLTTLNNQWYGSGFWEFQSEFTLNLNLNAGTYYFTLSNGQAVNGEAIGWGFNQNNPTLTSWTSRPFQTWPPNVSAESFIINGGVTPVIPTVPEPSTLLLLGSGLFGLAGFGKKLIKK